MTEQEKEVWRRANTKLYSVRIAKETGIPDALQRVERDKGIAPNIYIRSALAAALIRDGYLDHEPPADLRRLKKKQDSTDQTKEQ